MAGGDKAASGTLQMQALAERRLDGEQGKLRPLIIPPVFTTAAQEWSISRGWDRWDHPAKRRQNLFVIEISCSPAAFFQANTRVPREQTAFPPSSAPNCFHLADTEAVPSGSLARHGFSPALI